MPEREAAKARLSSELERLAEVCKGEPVTLGQLLPGLAPRDHALVTAVLSVGFVHPIPTLGLATASGLITMVAGVRMSLGLGPWVPERLRGRSMPGKKLAKVFTAGAALARKFERVVRPRGLWISAHPLTRRANGAAIALGGMLLASPFPPGASLPPALTILLLSVGTLEEDLLFLAAGYLALVFTMVFFGGVALLGWSGVKALLH